MDAHMRHRLVTIAAIAGLLLALPSSVRAEEPLRSGMIIGGEYTYFAMNNGMAQDCQWPNPECRVWLASGCDPALAGRDPAMTASIEEVSQLADGTTTRSFDWTGGAPSAVHWGGVVVQFWAEDCTEIPGAAWRSLIAPCCWTNANGTTFAIPRQARWMTVTTNDNLKVEWALR